MSKFYPSLRILCHSNHIAYYLSISIAIPITTQLYDYINVTWHEKIGPMYTKYTSLYYSMYLTLFVRYTSSVNCMKFSTVYRSSCKRLIDKLRLTTELRNFKVQKVVNFCVHISSIFSCQVTYRVIDHNYKCQRKYTK